MLKKRIRSSVGRDRYPAFVSVEFWIALIATLQVIGVLARCGRGETDRPLAAPSPERGHAPGFSAPGENHIHVHIIERVGIGLSRLKRPLKHTTGCGWRLGTYCCDSHEHD